jgi:hypothetical protein
MRKNALLPGFLGIASLLFCGINAEAQLVNDGATIKVQPGAFIFCQGNFENKNAGSISNDGKIEVQGNFLNTATYNTATADDSLILSGAGNVTLNGGSSTYTNLWINKSGAADRVTLTATMLLSGKLDYDQGLFTTDPIANPSYLFSAPTSAVFDFAAGKEIIGNVRRTGWSNGSTVSFNQPNMQLTTAAGTDPTDITVTMIPLTESGDPTDNQREVKRKFQFAQTGGTGFTADVRFPYVAGELNTNTEANLVPWGRFTGVWNGKLTPVTRDAANDWVSTTGIAQADFVNEWKLADPRYTMNVTAFLRGAWNAGPNMTTLLNSGGYIPVAHNYNLAPFNYTVVENAAVPNANVVDRVLIEMRMPSTGLGSDAVSSTIVGRKTGFLLNNGNVVELDGVSPLSFDINKQQENAFIVVRHRNHLGAMSTALSGSSSVDGSYDNDFRVLANVYKNIAASSDPVTLLPSSAFYGLWAGNANANSGIGNNVVNSTDVGVIKAAIGVLTPAGYHFQDVNLSGTINSTDVGFAKATIGSLGQSSSPNRGAPFIFRGAVLENVNIKSSVPEDK